MQVPVRIEVEILGICVLGNFDRTARMLEIKSNGSVEERRYSSLGSTGRPSEDVLIEKIADAMQDCGNVEGKFTPSSSPRRKVLASKHGECSRTGFILPFYDVALASIFTQCNY